MGFLRKLLLKVIYFLTKHKINKINVLDSKSTLQLIINHELSFIRFGDGEFNIINGNRGPQFQRNSRTLQSELREVLHFRSPKNLICIPNIFTQDTKISSHTNYNHNFWEKYLINNSLILAKTLDEKYTYGDALITRPFMDTQNKKYSSDIFNLFKQIWNNRDIVIIEGDKTLFGVNNELLNNASTIKRIIAPALNAYDYKNEIIQGDFHKINACKF